MIHHARYFVYDKGRRIALYVIVSRIPPGRIEAVEFIGYVFLRHVLAKVLIGHLPEHELKPAGGLWVGKALSGADYSG